jgi:endoglucanase
MCFKQASSIIFQGLLITEVLTYDVGVSEHRKLDTPNTNRLNINTFNSINWSTYNEQLMLNNKAFHLKGLNWSGFETNNHNLAGLNVRTMESYLDFIKSQGFNTLRIPITVQFVYEINGPINNCNPAFGNCSLSAKDTLLKLFADAAQRGIMIIIDMHSRSDNNYLDSLWYGSDYSEDQFIQAWNTILGIIVDQPNLLGIDLFNEPNGPATWGDGSQTDWYRMVNRLVEDIHFNVPRFNKIIFVEGINYSTDFSEYAKFPLNFSNLSKDLDNRIVLSPHTYGPSVSYDGALFDSSNFPNNLPAVWDKTINIIEKQYHRTSIIGEWGGLYIGKDKQWQDAFGQYLVNNCMEDTFVWNLSNSSVGTGGILEADNYTPVEDKLALYAKVQPNPSQFYGVITNTAISIDFGQYANPKCNY